MTYQRISRIDARFFNDRAMRVYEESDQGALYSFLERLPDRASDDEVEKELESCYDSIFGDDEEDLMDGDPEDQLENLLADGDAKDKDLEQESRRYVVLVKANGRYLSDLEMESDAFPVALFNFNQLYDQLDQILVDQGGGIGTVTLFDREGDVDVKFLCLTRFHREVQV